MPHGAGAVGGNPDIMDHGGNGAGQGGWDWGDQAGGNEVANWFDQPVTISPFILRHLYIVSVNSFYDTWLNLKLLQF